MTKTTLSADPRSQTGRRNIKPLRRQGLIPAHVYGRDLSAQNLQVAAKEFSQVYRSVGESSLLYLQVAKEPDTRPVFITTIARDPVTGQILHVSFHQVDLKTKIVASVAVKLVGESLAVKDGLGVLVQQLDEVEVEALPADMPEHLDLDISPLVAVGDSLTAANLKVGKNQQVKSDLSAVITKIEPLAKEEVKPAEVAPIAEAPAAEGQATGEQPA